MNIIIDHNSYPLSEKKINILVLTNSTKCITKITEVNATDVISYNVKVSEGNFITTNDFTIGPTTGLTQAYISSVKENVFNKKQILVIEIAGVDYNGFNEIYNLLANNIIFKIRCIVIVLDLETLSTFFELSDGNNIFLYQEQINLKKDKNHGSLFTLKT